MGGPPVEWIGRRMGLKRGRGFAIKTRVGVAEAPDHAYIHFRSSRHDNREIRRSGWVVLRDDSYGKGGVPPWRLEFSFDQRAPIRVSEARRRGVRRGNHARVPGALIGPPHPPSPQGRGDQDTIESLDPLPRGEGARFARVRGAATPNATPPAPPSRNRTRADGPYPRQARSAAPRPADS